MSFQGLHWLQTLGSGKASFGAGVVGRCNQHLTSTHMTFYKTLFPKPWYWYQPRKTQNVKQFSR